MIMASDECYRTLLMISQHWFRKWLGAVRQQAITWTTVDQDLQRHMVSLGPNELTHLPLNKMAVISQHFQMHFHEWKILYFDKNFTEVCSSGSNWQYCSIGLHNGLAPNRRQAIIWTNADPIHWCIYTALWEDELTHCGLMMYGIVKKYGQHWIS